MNSQGSKPALPNMKELYERLSRWFGIWEELLKEPEKLVLGRTVPSIIRSLLINLENPQASNLWKNELIELLHAILNNTHPVIDLMNIEFKTDVDELRQVLSIRLSQNKTGKLKNKTDKQKSDKLIFTILNRIKDAPSLALLRKEIETALTQDNSVEDKRFSLISRLMLDKALAKHDVSDLKELPNKVLTREATTLLLDGHIQPFVDDMELAHNLWEKWQDRITKGLTSERIASYISDKPVTITDVFSQSLWNHLAYELLETIAEQWLSGLRKILHENHQTTPITLMALYQEAMLKHGQFIIEKYIQAFLHQVLSIFLNDEIEQEGSQMNEIGLYIATYLRDEAQLVDKRGWYSEVELEILAEPVLEALAEVSSKILAELFSKEISLPSKEKSVQDIGNRLTSLFIVESDTISKDWNSLTEEDLSTLCLNWSARKSLHQELALLLVPLNEEITKQLENLLSTFASKSLAQWPIDMESFWKEWKDSFSLRANTFGTIFDYLPWSTLSAEQVSHIIGRLFDSLFLPESEYLVFFKVKGIQPQGAIWSTGNVTFYDPKVFDFSEGRTGLFSPQWLEGDNTAYAKVLVISSTSSEASEVAWQSLNNALNTLTFAASVNVRAGGLKPEIINERYVIRKTSGSWSAIGERTRAELPSDQGAISHELIKYGKAYDDLLKLSIEHPEKLNVLQTGFLRALHWYRKGRWEPDFAERFLFYWIGLEHMFTRGEFQKGELFDSIPRIHITWHNIEGFYWVRLRRGAMIKLIEENEVLRTRVDSCPDLIGWKYDYTVLIQPQKIEVLLSLTPDTIPETKKYFEDSREQFQRIDSKKAEVIKVVEELRNEFRFKLRLLYDLRNKLVHEALPYRAGMRLYAESLERILEDVLQKIAASASRQSIGYTSIKEVADWYQQPWI